MPVKERYWRATALEETIYRCFYRKSCKGSLQPGPNQTSYGDGLCRKGHKGPLCNVCENTQEVTASPPPRRGAGDARFSGADCSSARQISRSLSMR